jgi:predicted phage terminase large subunit-like protein
MFDLDSLPSLSALRAEKLRRSYSLFVKAAWQIADPGSECAWNWHMETISEHCQSLVKGKIQNNRLLINIPPRMSKSTLTSVMLPCWIWTFDPARSFMFASYSYDLSKDHAYKRRKILDSDWYKELFHVVPSSNRNNMMEIETEAGGLMYTTSLTGSTTGRGGDYLILDDPNNPKETESEVSRESTLQWFRLNWSTRANQPKTAKWIVIQQRTHMQDITGFCLGLKNWEHLKIPMEYSRSQSKSTSLNWVDPRQTDGELLHEERIGRSEVESLKKILGPYGSSGQLAQEPAPAEGGIIKRQWIKHYERDGDYISFVDPGNQTPYRFEISNHIRFGTVDLAVSKKDLDKSDPDYTVIASWTVFPTIRGPMLFLLDLLRERVEGPDIEKKIEEAHERWKFAMVGVETIGFQLIIAQGLLRKGIPVREMSNSLDAIYRLDKDKQARAYSATPLMADGRFFVPTYAPWLGEYISELITFPNYGHDDQVDVTSAAVSLADRMAGISMWEEQEAALKQKKPSTPDHMNSGSDDSNESNILGMRIDNKALSGYKYAKP